MATKLICCRKSIKYNFAFGFILKELCREIAKEKKVLIHRVHTPNAPQTLRIV